MQPEPEVQDFEEFPDIQDILAWGGVPGVTYAYIKGKNISKAVQCGFEFLHRSPSFTVNGESYVVMADKSSKPIPGAANGSGRCIVLVDQDGVKPDVPKVQQRPQS